MAKAARATRSLPDEIVFWEILVRLPPQALLRCRSVCRAWRRVTSRHDFVLTHHGRQPSLPIFPGDDGYVSVGIRDSHDILAFDHRAATDDEQLHTVATLDKDIYLEASCDGLLVLFKRERLAPPASPSATWPCVSLGIPWDFNVLGMYSHHPTGEYQLLLRASHQGSRYHIGCYVSSLCSDQPPRHIGWHEMALGLFTMPVMVRDNLHWYPAYPSGLSETKTVAVFDPIAESFRQIFVPIDPTDCSLFEMDGTLGIHSCDYAMQNIDIWVLQNYESEIWELKYRIKLLVPKIRRDYEDSGERWNVNVVFVDAGVLLLVSLDGWLLQVDNGGKLVNSYHRRRGLSMSGLQLKQSLVQHTFFPSLDGYVVNASPFIAHVK